jgi:hypothetical protein
MRHSLNNGAPLILANLSQLDGSDTVRAWFSVLAGHKGQQETIVPNNLKEENFQVHQLGLPISKKNK